MDDDYLVRWSLKKAFAKKGYDVAVAASGEEAMEMVRKEQFDIVITDLKMPGISGTELLDGVRHLAPCTKAVLVTAYDHEMSEEKAREKGAELFVRKPFALQDFVGAVDRLLDAEKELN